MADFGLVIFNDLDKLNQHETNKAKNLAGKLLWRITGLLLDAGFFKSRFGTKLYFSTRKRGFQNGLSCHCLFEDLRAWIIKLPFSSGTLFHLNMDYISAWLQRLCTEKGIGCCLVPEPIRKKVTGDVFKDQRLPGKLLFKSLLVPVLEKIFSGAGLRIDSQEMVIISGNDTEELFDMVRLLEPFINFVTVVTADKGKIEDRFTEIFSDSGLSFLISTEFRSQLKHAGLIINLGQPSDILRYRMSGKSLLINLFDSVETGFSGENTVLNDITFEITSSDIKNLMYELHGYYKKSELYDIIFANRLKPALYDKFNCKVAEYIRKMFIETGCSLSGFIGRRGVITPDNVIKSIYTGIK